MRPTPIRVWTGIGYVEEVDEEAQVVAVHPGLSVESISASLDVQALTIKQTECMLPPLLEELDDAAADRQRATARYCTPR